MTAFWCMMVGIPLLVADLHVRSLEAQLPEPIVRVWAAMLIVGPILLLVGLFMTQRRVMAEALTWMKVEALGLKALAYSSFIYVLCILATVERGGDAAAMFIFVFGLTCNSHAAKLLIDVEDYKESIGVV